MPGKCLLGDHKGGPLALRVLEKSQALLKEKAGRVWSGEGYSSCKVQFLGLSSWGFSGHSVCGFIPILWDELEPGQSSGVLSPVSLLLWHPPGSSVQRNCMAHSGDGGHKVCKGQGVGRECRGWRRRARWACHMHCLWHRGCRVA